MNIKKWLGLLLGVAALTAVVAFTTVSIVHSSQQNVALGALNVMGHAFDSGPKDKVLQIETCVAGFIRCKKNGEVGDLDKSTLGQCEALKNYTRNINQAPWYSSVKVSCVDWAPVYGATHTLDGKKF